ncbi:hypothetical protein [Massilia endophytica]|uniref:hypothetical protein n=1 Tax=Massilia endophytica TaxID=2899220 RepID=UPI001E5F4E8E|nr:hypothetical protein [Massilia endophytica]UGQ44954.1 hypothetical protein LSQ66_14225 [Massilia endophytica]
MTPVSSADAEKARKYHSLALQRISSVGQNNMAERLKTSESTVSRFVAADLERACAFLSVLGLKVVPSEMKCYDAKTIDTLMHLAREHLNRLETPEQLSFD